MKQNMVAPTVNKKFAVEDDDVDEQQANRIVPTSVTGPARGKAAGGQYIAPELRGSLNNKSGGDDASR